MDIRSFFGTNKKKSARNVTSKKKEKNNDSGDINPNGNDNNQDTENDQDHHPAQPKPKNKMENGTATQEGSKTTRVDITAESFFANSKSQEASKKRQKKVITSISIVDTDSATEGEEEITEPVQPNKRVKTTHTSQVTTTRQSKREKASPRQVKSQNKQTSTEHSNRETDDHDDGFDSIDTTKNKEKEQKPEDQHNSKRPSRAAKRQKSPPSDPTENTKKKGVSKKTTAAKRNAPTKRELYIEPGATLDSFDLSSAASECLQGLTFVFSGVLDNLSRDNSIEFVKNLGARVTSQVSSKTHYLVVGEMLEDGRHHTEGSKFKKASGLSVGIVNGEQQLYGLCQAFSDRKEETDGPHQQLPESNPSSETTKKSPPKQKAVTNPYASKRKASNPYARTTNPSTKTAGVSAKGNPYVKTNDPHANSSGRKKTAHSIANDPSMLWADKYAPSATHDILGNKDIVNKLEKWLKSWEHQFNNEKSRNKAFSAPGGPKKAVLLSGPPGIGKTTTANLVASEAGRHILELNASDVRSKKALAEGLGDVTGSQVLNFSGNTNLKKRCIIMDEVDGMGAGDRSGMTELIKMIKDSKVPIICICNDRQSQKIRSLVPYCLDLKYRRPVKTVIARRAVRVGEAEGMKIEQNAAEAMAESCGNDVRQVLNCLQMWASNKGKKMTYKDLKERENSIKKDEMLRVNIFEACKMIVQGRHGISGSNPKEERSSLYKRSDAFFVDYSLMGLNVHQNYLKVMASQFGEAKRSNDDGKMESFLDRMHDATLSMSDFAVAEEGVRGGDQNWNLLPFCGMMTVKAGFHGGGNNGSFMPGFPEFTSWMGKNSTRGKKLRMLHELAHHMNYKVSCDSTELRLNYLPVIRDRFQLLLLDSKSPRTAEAIGLMDQYGLDRDDIFESLDEFKMNSSVKKIADIDSKQKAAFTREYNKGSHTSQALVAEQGVGKKSKRTKSTKEQDLAGPDSVNDDLVEDSDLDDEDDAEQLKELFKKKTKPKRKPGSNSKNVKRQRT